MSPQTALQPHMCKMLKPSSLSSPSIYLYHFDKLNHKLIHNNEFEKLEKKNMQTKHVKYKQLKLIIIGQ